MTTDEKEIRVQLKDYIEQSHQRMFRRHRAGGGGLEIVHLSAGVMDNVIRQVFQFCRDQGQGSAPTSEKLALVALGGYGRGELNPQSDLDILFLYRKKRDGFIDFTVKETLYMLWDLGFRVGHCCRSIKNCLEIAALDLSARTSMMESRHICGDDQITNRLSSMLETRIVRRGARNFLKIKREERDQRHAEFDASTRYLEPNVKEGVGGLRDCHLALWCAMAGYGVSNLDDMARKGVLTDQELEELKHAYDFLHRVRNELHFTTDQTQDTLSIEMQKQVSHNLGYLSDGVFSDVELFMRDYFLRARDIERHSRLVLDKCMHRERRDGGKGGRSKGKKVDEGLYVLNGEIVMKGDPFPKSPILMFKLFRHCQVAGVRPCWTTLQAVCRNLHLLDRSQLDAPQVARIFKEILSSHGAARTLRYMHEAGLLGKLIPEFEELTCLIQDDLYHHYSVDEHTLRVIGRLEDLIDTQEEELMELSSILKRIHDLWSLKLALLLHDIGKVEGRGHAKKGVKISVRILDRLGVAREDRQDILFLVENHLAMNHQAQRRDIRDQKTVTDFARIVETQNNLERLYLMSYSDMKGVGPQVWTTWKGALLWELYHETHNYFIRGGEEEPTWMEVLSDVRSGVMAELGNGFNVDEIDGFFHAMPYRYLINTPPESIARHLRLVAELGDQSLTLDYTQNESGGYTQLVVCTREKPGLFARIAGALSAMNINIITGEINTGTDGLALDMFQVNGLNGELIMESDIWKKFKSYLTDIIEEKLTVEQLIEGRKKPLQKMKATYTEISPKVTCYNNLSDTHTVIEVIAPDKLGLLYSITHTIYGQGASVYVAKISTEAHRAINAFYINDFEGRKIEDEKDLNILKDRLLEVVSQVS